MIQFLQSFKKVRFLLCMLSLYLSNFYTLKGNGIEYNTLYLITDLAEDNEEMQKAIPNKNLFSIKRIISDSNQYRGTNIDHDYAGFHDDDDIVLEHNPDLSWSYDGITWDLGSLKKGLAYLVRNPDKDYTNVETDGERIRIRKRLQLSVLANMQYAEHAYYFEIEYKQNNKNKIMRLLCVKKGYEYANGYLMKIPNQGQSTQEGEVNLTQSCSKYENREINLIRFLAELGQNRSLIAEESSIPSSESNETSVLKLPISFKFNTYTNRKNEEDTNYDCVYTLDLDEKAQMTCHEYQYEPMSSTLIKNDQFQVSVSPILPPADYSIFVIEGMFKRTFHTIEAFNKVNQEGWHHAMLGSDRMKEMIEYSNADLNKNLDNNKYDEQDIELKRTLGEGISLGLPRLGKTYTKLVKVKTGLLNTTRYKHEIFNFKRGQKEDLNFHYFSLSNNQNHIKAIAVPNVLLKGKGRLQFEEEDSRTAQWSSCSKEVNQQYALMLIDTLINQANKNKNMNQKYQLTDDSKNSTIKVSISQESTTMYREYWDKVPNRERWDNLFKVTNNIRIKSKDSSDDSGQAAKKNGWFSKKKRYYMTGSAGIITTLMAIRYGIKRRSQYDDDDDEY